MIENTLTAIGRSGDFASWIPAAGVGFAASALDAGIAVVIAFAVAAESLGCVEQAEIRTKAAAAARHRIVAAIAERGDAAK